MTDVDGNVYKTIPIGTQIWMAENLKTTKYRNGDLIGTTAPATKDISTENTPKYQWAYEGIEGNVETYGRLYTRYAVTDSRNVCPTGWHLPTDEEWTILINYLGGESVAGGKLQEINTAHWQNQNVGTTNVSGFTALPGGKRMDSGIFNGLANNGYGNWWSSTTLIVPKLASFWLIFLGNDVINYNAFKTFGFSVRCLKGEPTIPNVSTVNITGITNTTSTCGGNVTTDGGALVIGRGVCWSISQNPTTSDNKTSNGTGTGPFASTLSGLLGNTTYYVRAYATNSIGTVYGNQVSFTTNPATLPVLSITTPTSITQTTAASGGTISSDGGAPITGRGVCWSTTTNPTIANSITSDGVGSGGFTSSITGLTLNTTYYVRAYATNNVGSAYCNQISFTTLYSPTFGIGTSYQGGIVAYILKTGDLGYDASVPHGLIVAPSNQSTGIQWYNGTFTKINGTEIFLGTGNANTETIVSIQGPGSYAAQLCYDLVLGGYSDWYLPSIDELNKLYINKAAIGGFANTTYWSSSMGNFSNTGAWYQSFADGNQGGYITSNQIYVRAARSF